MSSPLVTQPDVEAALLRPLTTVEANYINALCEQASAKLRIKLPSVDTRIALAQDAPGYIDPAAVAAMLAGVIKLAIVNPRGLWSSSDTEGPYSHSETYPGSRAGSSVSAPGALVITDENLSQLFPSTGFALPATIRTPVPPEWCRSW